ncbi:sulfatase family protein [Persicirhabdus sediminis]|uniref:Sulfatase n=1 Tax=Persicirhabdus sediminis TaxID=454144 RepID=A0A8J7SLE1_9BACT|nr:sulfatase [Persicirhabdus sediminis]MBK1792749.1 sulfatase [Persicirhabdus sediminis]
MKTSRLQKTKQLTVAGMAALAATSSLVAEDAKPDPRPNILFIFSDDHALKTIGAYNPEYTADNPLNATPNIDRIAEEGAVFTRSFCTNSICQPSRASVLTGKHSHKNGVWGNGAPWDNQQWVFTRELAKNGYQTAMIGKWHMHPYPSTEFDYHKTLTGYGGQGRYYQPLFINHDGQEVQETGYSTDLITDYSIEWMENRDKTKPFLMMCQYKAPHTNVMPALRHLREFKEDIPVPDTYFDNFDGRSEYLKHTWMSMHGLQVPEVLKISPKLGEYDREKLHHTNPYHYMVPLTLEEAKAWHKHYDPMNDDYNKRRAEGKLQDGSKELSIYRYQRYMNDYMAVIDGVDENVGRLMKYLDDEGIADNTIIIYSSDQGFLLGEHGITDKRVALEESMMMPFIIRWPGHIKPGQRNDAMIQNIDYAPTFLEAAGIEIPADVQGRSLLPVFQGETPDDWRTSIYYHYHQTGEYNLPKIESVRSKRYKLNRYYGHRDPELAKLGEQWELFDLDKDPQELNNLYNNPEMAPVRQEMKEELDKLREQYEVQEQE